MNYLCIKVEKLFAENSLYFDEFKISLKFLVKKFAHVWKICISNVRYAKKKLNYSLIYGDVTKIAAIIFIIKISLGVNRRGMGENRGKEKTEEMVDLLSSNNTP